MNNLSELHDIAILFDRPRVIGVCADVNEGKSNLLCWMVLELRKQYKFNLYSYGLDVDLQQQKIYSVDELERIQNGIIVIDEFATLFDLDDRKLKKQIEKTFRLICHIEKNNIIILAGLPENYKKFLSAKLSAIIFKTCTLADFINGSKIKYEAFKFSDPMLGSTVLKVNVDQALVFDGQHYHKISVPYLREFDSKIHNAKILTPRGTHK